MTDLLFGQQRRQLSSQPADVPVEILPGTTQLIVSQQLLPGRGGDFAKRIAVAEVVGRRGGAGDRIGTNEQVLIVSPWR